MAAICSHVSEVSGGGGWFGVQYTGSSSACMAKRGVLTAKRLSQQEASR